MLHFGEHFIPDGFLGALADGHHQKLLQEGSHHATGKDTGDAQEVFHQGTEIGGTGCHHGKNIVIHQMADVFAALGLGEGSDDDAEDDDDQIDSIGLHIAQQTQESLFGVSCFAAVAAHSDRRHYSSSPFCWE